jgi:hypothetical protein
MATLHTIDDPKYKPGQVWSYHHRQGEDKSRLTILKVEEMRIQGRLWETIVHISVDNISINSADGTIRTNIPHIPFPRESIEQSTIAVLEQGDGTLNFDSVAWRDNVRDGDGGIFTTSVARALDFIAEALSRNPKSW